MSSVTIPFSSLSFGLSVTFPHSFFSSSFSFLVRSHCQTKQSRTTLEFFCSHLSDDVNAFPIGLTLFRCDFFCYGKKRKFHSVSLPQSILLEKKNTSISRQGVVLRIEPGIVCRSVVENVSLDRHRTSNLFG